MTDNYLSGLADSALEEATAGVDDLGRARATAEARAIAADFLPYLAGATSMAEYAERRGVLAPSLTDRLSVRFPPTEVPRLVQEGLSHLDAQARSTVQRAEADRTAAAVARATVDTAAVLVGAQIEAEGFQQVRAQMRTRMAVSLREEGFSDALTGHVDPTAGLVDYQKGVAEATMLLASGMTSPVTVFGGRRLAAVGPLDRSLMFTLLLAYPEFATMRSLDGSALISDMMEDWEFAVDSGATDMGEFVKAWVDTHGLPGRDPAPHVWGSRHTHHTADQTGPTIDSPEGVGYTPAPDWVARACQRRFEGGGTTAMDPKNPGHYLHGVENFWDGPSEVMDNGDGRLIYRNPYTGETDAFDETGYWSKDGTHKPWGGYYSSRRSQRQVGGRTADGGIDVDESAWDSYDASQERASGDFDYQGYKFLVHVDGASWNFTCTKPGTQFLTFVDGETPDGEFTSALEDWTHDAVSIAQDPSVYASKKTADAIQQAVQKGMMIGMPEFTNPGAMLPGFAYVVTEPGPNGARMTDRKTTDRDEANRWAEELLAREDWSPVTTSSKTAATPVSLNGPDLRQVDVHDLKPGDVLVTPIGGAMYSTGPLKDGTGTGVQFLYGFPQGYEFTIVSNDGHTLTATDSDGKERSQAIPGDKKVLVKKTSALHTAMPTPVDAGIEIGDIYYSSWGYDQTNIDFYEVTRLMGASIGVRPVGKRVVGEEGGPHDSVVAIPHAFVGPEFTKRVPSGGPAGWINLNSYSGMSKWDGTPKTQTGYGYGH